MAGKIWRIGLMGHASNLKNVLLCLSALDDALTALGAPIESGLAIAATRKVIKAGD
jgi:alanine-glyoxylate transaminase/serine-glyoxylate transaminase/serine-pyruvate transaminase